MSHKPVIGIISARHMTGGLFPAYCTNAHYLEQVEAAGGIPLQLPLIPGAYTENLEAYVALCDGFLLPGGADFDSSWYGEALLPHLTHGAGELDMASQAAGIALVCGAVESGKPVLGICLGIQVLNVAMGGSLYQDIPSQISTGIVHSQKAVLKEDRWKLVHGVRLAEGSLIARLLGGDTAYVNSFHHQAVKAVAPGFTATAWAEDGVVEAMEYGNGRVLGVQWHPENMAHAGMAPALALFRWLVGEAAH